VIAFVTGRLFHGLVALLPMMWGAAAGAAARRRAVRRLVVAAAGPGRSPTGSVVGRWTRRSVMVLTGVLLVAFTAAVARPVSTAPITGPDGDRVPGSIAELGYVDVNGKSLGLMIRGHDTENPVLLFLAGGPGGSELGAMRRHLPELEERFTVVTWDQRGTGRSYGEIDPVDTLTLDNAVDDTLVVTDYLRERFDQDRIFLVGQSWGTTLGILAVQAAPERYRAFVGVGQMVSQRATDWIFYDDTVAWAEETGQADLVTSLREIGPPPYADPRNYEIALSHEMEMYPYDHAPNSEGQGQMSENLLVPEYSLTEQVRILAATLDTFAALYPQLQGIDFRETATSFDIPMFFVQGAYEAPGRAELFDDWYPLVDAPVKDRLVLGTSGHRPLFEQPQEFTDYLTDVVLPRTSP
jgi:pimeloyl-ACP methyl ester carboxylesterase